MTTILDERTTATAELTVAERLRRAIDDSGMTQLELATRLAAEVGKANVASVRRLLNKWLAGTKPGRRYALKLALIFDTAPGYFLEESSTAPADGEAYEAESLVPAFAAATRFTIPPTFKRDFIAEELTRNFLVENILIDDIDDWTELESASGTARLDETSLRLGEWYVDTPIVPGIVITELLSQVASVALLTDPVYRKQIVLVGAIDHLRMRKVVEYGTRLRIGAELRKNGLHNAGRIAQYETWARLDDGSGDLVAAAVVTLSTR